LRERDGVFRQRSLRLGHEQRKIRLNTIDLSGDPIEFGAGTFRGRGKNESWMQLRDRARRLGPGRFNDRKQAAFTKRRHERWLLVVGNDDDRALLQGHWKFGLNTRLAWAA
jgi:hypothetical protein